MTEEHRQSCNSRFRSETSQMKRLSTPIGIEKRGAAGFDQRLRRLLRPHRPFLGAEAVENEQFRDWYSESFRQFVERRQLEILLALLYTLIVFVVEAKTAADLILCPSPLSS